MTVTLEWGLLPLLKTSLTVSIVILPALLFSKALNRRYAARWKYWLWLLLALRLLLPVELAPSRAPVRLPAPAAAQEVLREPVLTWGGEEEPLPASPAPDQASPSTPAGEPAARSITGEEALGILWAAGAAAFFLGQGLRQRAFRRRLLAGGSRVKNREVLELLAQVAGELGLRRVPALRVSREAPGPLVLGAARPVLFLPEEEYSGEELYFIFLHELIHCRRRDIAYKLVLLLANGVHWFNPLVWLMFRQASGDLELSCDAEALQGASPEDRRRYGRAILDSVGRQGGRGAALTTHFSAGGDALRERFEGILGQGKGRRGLFLLGTAVLAAALLGGMVACGDSSGGSGPAEIRADPAEFLTPADFDEALLEELGARLGLTWSQGADAPGALGEFIQTHPHYLADLSGRVQTSRGDSVEDGGGLARLQTDTPGEDLLNRERLAAFAQNCRAGVPDQIVILSGGSPVPLWVNIYTSAEGGSYTVERLYRPAGEGMTSTTVPALQETETEWLLVQEADWKVRYPKYGYEPIPLADPPREAGEEETLALLEEFAGENGLLSSMTAELVPGEDREVDGLLCPTFRGVTPEGYDSGDLFAVAPDLSRVWQIEQVNGQPLLLAHPAQGPEG